MKHILGTNLWLWRAGIAILALLFFGAFIGVCGYVTFYHLASSQLLSIWFQFGLSVFTSLMFLAVGILVWLYGHERSIASVLFGFCLAMSVVFGGETGAVEKHRLLVSATACGTVIAIPLLLALLLLFPRNYFVVENGQTSHFRMVVQRMVHSFAPFYLLVLALYGGVLLICNVFFAVLTPIPPNWFFVISYIYEFIGLVGIITTVSLSYYLAVSYREKQQIRLFLLGVIVAIAPFFLLTILPRIFGSETMTINAQFSTLTFILFPLALGYSILRYQLLIYDAYIRRAVAWIIGCVGLLLLVYVVVIITEAFAGQLPSLLALLIVGMTALFAPLVWWFARLLTERVFYRETLYYRRLIEMPAFLLETVLDLDEVVRLLITSAMHMFETANVCFFVLDEHDGYYHMLPTLQSERGEEKRIPMLDTLVRVFHANTACKESYWLHENLALVKQLHSVTRPVFLRELHSSSLMGRFGLTVNEHMHEDSAQEKIVVTPIRVQGKMIGLLFLGERGDYQRYAGPDLDAIMLLLARFSPLLETARLAQKAREHATLLNNLYSVSILPQEAFATVEDLAEAYTSVASHALPVVAEVWLCEPNAQNVRRVAASGAGIQLFPQAELSLVAHDWHVIFHNGAISSGWERLGSTLPSCLHEVPALPVAWLPLRLGNKNVGIFTLIYQHPHVFTKEEIRVLEMFTSQCAVALENTRITLELRAAYERQKELDALKDQFIITTSHELRTPLTAVLGYVELLEQYGSELSEDARASFIRKAHRGCDELALMMENIMDASRVHIDAEKVRLQHVPLVEAVAHVVEMLGALIANEHRQVTVDVPLDIVVWADNLRLRQVILNIFNNALKYSPFGTKIEIHARKREGFAIVTIRDYGSGVPPEDQVHLFERFVRLERDMNSPVRGAGLGLYICKRLIEAMGGQIWVESAGHDGEGSSFMFSLPLTEHIEPRVQRGANSQIVPRLS